ncbi:hypothetical protein ECZU06_23140 [Escherichia coli]|nr:hypothetical protein ECZU06_23140 [Escherichia coli]GHL24605.1 hypothetical protein ECZU25_14180 [Escherichia coli]
MWAEEGIFFFERFAADSPEQKLTLCDDVAGLSQAGELPFNPDTSAGAETECVSMFRYEAYVRPSSVQSQDYTFKVPDWPGMYEQQGENLNGQLEQYEIFDYPGRFKDEQHGKDFTLYQMESLRSDAEKATGQSNSPKLWPGTRFTLTGHPQKMLNREWQVVQSILSGDQPQALHGSRERNHAGKSVRGDTGGPDVASTAAKQTEGGRATERHCHRSCGRGNLLRRTRTCASAVSLGQV